MIFTRSSPNRIGKVSSDNVAVGFDLITNLTYMSVLTVGGLDRDRMLERCSQQRLKTAVFFEYVLLLAKRVGFSYTQAYQAVSQRARASNVKSLLLRFAAAISSGESEKEFIVQETRAEGERYSNEYERSIENLRKWTDAYAAILISVTLIMVVSLVSTMMGSLGPNFIIMMAGTLFFITGVGVFVIYKVAPVEQATYDAARTLPKDRRMARFLLLTLGPVGLSLAASFMLLRGVMDGSPYALLAIGVSLLPAGYYAWKDNSNVNKLDSELPTFLRSMGNIAGATGINFTEALGRIDMRSMGTLQPHIERLQVRLSAHLPADECWEAFRVETGSELVNRTTHMLVDGSELGGRPDRVGQICSDYAVTVTELRAKRHLTASTFSFLALPMHATMAFVLVFVLQIITSFNTQLSEASFITEVNARLGQASEDVEGTGYEVPDVLELPPGITVPGAEDLTGGLDMFGLQDMTFISQMIVLVVFILTIANTLAPKLASGGSRLKTISYLSPMCIISGVVLSTVPFVASQIFSV